MRQLVLFLMAMLAMRSPLHILASDKDMEESSRDFTFNGINYTVIDEDAKTCKTKCGHYASYNLGMSGDYMDVYWYYPGTDANDKILIPEYVSDGSSDYQVVQIGDFSFAGCSELIHVELPKSVEVIGMAAFVADHQLESINFPDSLKIIKVSAFSACTSLGAIFLNEGLEEIGRLDDDSVYHQEGEWMGDWEWTTTSAKEGAFSGCGSLKSIVIPKSIKYLGREAFANCKSLENVELPDSMEDTCCMAGIFRNCYNLTTFDFPTSFIGIPDGFLDNCTRLVSVKLPDSLEKIGVGAFYDCIRLKNIILPPNLKRIESYAFNNCDSLENIDLHEGLEQIGFSAFSKTGISNVIIPSTVTNLEGAVFADCKNLQEVFLPNGITTLDHHIFARCSALETILIPSDVRTISTDAFLDCQALKKIILSDELECIEPNAFLGCKNIIQVIYPSNNPKEVWDERLWENWQLRDLDRKPFEPEVFQKGELKVQYGMQNEIRTLKPWKWFACIEEEDFSDVDQIGEDGTASTPVEIFDMNGQKVGFDTENLPKGLYIVRKGSKVDKIKL